MAVRFDVHAVLNWYIVAGDRVVLRHGRTATTTRTPRSRTIDFAGVSILTYGGERPVLPRGGLLGQDRRPGGLGAWYGGVRGVGAARVLEHGRLEALDAQRIADNLETLRTGRIT